MKKIGIVIFTILLVASFIPVTARAATTHNVANGEIFYIPDNNVASGDTIKIASYAEVTISSDLQESTLTNVSISCGQGSTVTIKNVKIDNGGYDGSFALGFTGSGNTLILEGQNYLEGGFKAPGVRVNSSVFITIQGSGSLEAVGGKNAAAIGSQDGINCGNITISGSVSILANTSDSLEPKYSAAIGGGNGGNGGTVNISGNANVIAKGGEAGIGGGKSGASGHINISGGTVFAYGYRGAGIGGGEEGPVTSITLTGGTIYAARGAWGGNAAIGRGMNCTASSGPLIISNDAVVFIPYNGFISPSPTGYALTHNHFSDCIPENKKVFGYNVDTDEMVNCYIPNIEYLITYKGNGGAPETRYDAQFTFEDRAQLSPGTLYKRSHYYMWGWSTSPTGNGTIYNLSQTAFLSNNITLYAQWSPISVQSVSLDQSELTIAKGYSEKLTATITPSDALYPEITWSTSDESIAIVSDTGEVTGIGEGTAVITATAEGKSDQCNVEVIIPAGILDIDFNMYLNESHSLLSYITPVDSTYSNIAWSSSDESIVAVDLYGNVECGGLGRAIITGELENGLKHTCYITVTERDVDKVNIYPSSLNLNTGDTHTLTAIVRPDNASHSEVSWDSSDEDIAEVDSYGEVTAYSPGTATITATAGGKTHSCTLTVIQPVLSVSISPTEMDLIVGEMRKLDAKALPNNAIHQTITWLSLNPDIATVDQNGMVTALRAGTAVIRAACDDKDIDCQVTVGAQDVTSMELDLDEKILHLGEWFKLHATVYPENATSPQITWSSASNQVATVDEDGIVEAVDFGACYICAYAGDESAACLVKVEKIAVNSVNLSESSKSLYIGDMFTLYADILPADANFPDIVWHSTDENVASVSNVGVVEAVGDGICKITATADGVTSECEVSVGTKSVISVTLNHTSKSLYIGDMFAISASVKPDDAANPSVSWSTSDSKVATITGGVVKAIGQGTCTISATADGKTDTCDIRVDHLPTAKVSSVSLSMPANTVTMLYVGDEVRLTAYVYPSEADNKTVSWQSSDVSVATVDSEGLIAAIAPGNSTITASAGGHSATYNITVSERVDDALHSPSPTLAPTSSIQSSASPEVRKVTLYTLDVSTLPKGAKYILLPCGESIEINGNDMIQISVPCEDIDDKGNIEFVILDSEQVPLASMDVDAASAITSSEYSQKTISAASIIIIALAAIAAGAMGTLLFVKLIINRKK